MFVTTLLRKKLTRWLSERAQAYYTQRRWHSAHIYYQLISRLDPSHAYSMFRLGQINKCWGNGLLAAQYWRAALSLDAAYHDAAMAASYELKEMGESQLVEQFLQEYRQHFPADVSCRRLLADIFAKSDRETEAAKLLIEVQRDHPSDSSLLLVVAKALRDCGDRRAAVPYYDRYVRECTEDAPALKQYGDLLLGLREWQRAGEILRQALALDRNDPQTLTSFGFAQYRLGRFTDATDALTRAVRIAPNAVHPYVNLGGFYLQQGRLATAKRIFSRALALPRVPGVDATLQSNALYLTNLLPESTPAEIAEAHRTWGRTMMALVRSSPTVEKKPQRVLRLGFVSPDFRKHSMFYFLAPLFSNRNPGFQLYCYSDVSSPDECTEWLRSRSDQWYNVRALNDEELCEKIRSDTVDILFDLAGHIAGNRLGVFARRAAPIQITYLGYPNGTGLTTMDYRLTDIRADPPSADRYYVERLLRLPGCFLCYQPASESPPVAPVPMIEQGHVTFGSFNNLAKINSKVLRVWCEILRCLPSACLILKSKPFGDAHVCERYRRYFRRRNIDPARIQMTGWTQEVGHHLACYGAIDIALDSFPYNGTTTTCEALHMGVPVVTLAGDTHAGRVGVSLLGQVGLPELVAETEEAYIRCAVSLAQTPARLDSYRATLRQRLCDSLGDQPRFAQNFASTLRAIWERWCQN